MQTEWKGVLLVHIAEGMGREQNLLAAMLKWEMMSFFLLKEPCSLLSALFCVSTVRKKKCRQGWTTLLLPFDTCPVPTSMQNKATITMWGFNTNSASRSIDAYGVVKFMFSQPFIYLFTLATFFTTIVPVPIDDSTFTSQLALKLCRDPYFVPGASSTLCVIV